MITESDIQTVLEADAGVGGIATLLTGGVYTSTELGRQGIDSRTASAAFDGPVLKPCALIRIRSNTPDNQILDAGAQRKSFRQVANIFLYEDGDSDRSIIEAAEARLFALLESQRINYHPLLEAGTVWDREEALNNAHMARATYHIHGVR